MEEYKARTRYDYLPKRKESNNFRTRKKAGQKPVGQQMTQKTSVQGCPLFDHPGLVRTVVMVLPTRVQHSLC